MKTILTKKIDDHIIIIGFDKPVMEPILTKIAVIAEIKKTEEYKDIKAKKTEIEKNVHMATQARNNSKNSKTPNEKNKFWREYLDRLAIIEDIQAKLKKIFSRLKKKEKEIILKNAIYFDPKPGEKIITDKEAESLTIKLKTALEDNCLVDESGNNVKNLIGKTFWTKVDGLWSGRTIDRIGVDKKTDEILQQDLSKSDLAAAMEQMEIQRISSLSAPQKEVEKTDALNNASAEAASIRSQYEIQGVSNALKKSQDWYEQKKAEIEAKYQ